MFFSDILGYIAYHLFLKQVECQARVDLRSENAIVAIYDTVPMVREPVEGPIVGWPGGLVSLLSTLPLSYCRFHHHLPAPCSPALP